jgi:hypothetical protein
MASSKNDLRLDLVAAHVVDWHNRHPLVRRISGLRVHSSGYVAVPFLAPPGSAPQALPAEVAVEPAVAAGAAAAGSLRERAMARAKDPHDGPAPDSRLDRSQPVSSLMPSVLPGATPARPLTAVDAAFDEDFFAPYKPGQLARWVVRHGASRPKLMRGAAVRRVPARAGLAPEQLHWLWVLTAQVDLDRARTRVLVGKGKKPAVLGRRLWSPPRIAALATLAAVVVGAVTGVVVSAGAQRSPTPTALPRAASAALAAAPVASAAQPAPVVAASAAEAAASAPAAALASAASAAGAASQPAPAGPVDVEPTLGKVNLPSLGPVIDERRRNAERTASAPAAAAVARTQAPATAPAFAVMTRVLRTRSESEQLASAMRDLLQGSEHPRLRVEVIAVGDDWRVVSWPYIDKATAAKARELLAARGMRVDVVEF